MIRAPVTGDTIRKKFALRVMVAEKDARLGDVGTRVDGVASCRLIIEEAMAEIDSLRRAMEAARLPERTPG